jgi:hypothetical protein
MSASQEHDKPEAVGSAIVSTPLGKMAKTASPTKKPPRRLPLATPTAAAVAAAAVAGDYGSAWYLGLVFRAHKCKCVMLVCVTAPLGGSAVRLYVHA